jgi:hypothetical protein
MTPARHRRKAWISPIWLVLVALGGCGIFASPRGAFAEGVETNAHTGLAISGFDPVAYFTDHKPRFGKPELEISLKGAIWRFENPGNRAAFVAHPEVYMPRFGGYDPVAVARGASVPGHPLFWTVMSERLYLFYSPDARAVFLADPGRIIETAERRWPAVARTIGH